MIVVADASPLRYLVLIGEVGKKVVGFAMALPDVNQALKRARTSAATRSGSMRARHSAWPRRWHGAS